MPSRTLFITATITPPADAIMLVRTDPAERMADYLRALDFYLTLVPDVFDRIAFVDNSASDLSALISLADRAGKKSRVDFLSYPGLDYPPEHGRGYGEALLSDHARSHNPALTNLDPITGIVWKVTGRYIVRNLAPLARSMPEGCELYCDLKNRPGPWMDTRLFAFTPAAYDRWLHGIYPTLSMQTLKHPAEVEMRRYVGTLLPTTTTICPRLRVEPLVDGVRGYDGKNYSQGAGKVKVFVRSAARKALPFLWV